jgi:endonuclease YncB( thermonuclease family)
MADPDTPDIQYGDGRTGPPAPQRRQYAAPFGALQNDTPMQFGDGQMGPAPREPTNADGDTVKFGRQRVRLFGIDAPKKGQPCDDGKWYPGPLATKALIAFIGGRPVSCRQVDYDHKNNRPVAVCFAGKDDLQALVVSAGWAWAYTAFSDQYVDAERRAAARGVGVHAHRCQPPWEWRALKRAER